MPTCTEIDLYLVTLASVYGLFQPVPEERREDAYQTMHSVLDALTPLAEQPSSRLVIGGDFNMWLHSPQQTIPPHRAAFDRLEGLGLSDSISAMGTQTISPMPGCCCGRGDDCTNVRTMRLGNKPDSKPWQNDYLYATATAQATTWRAMDSDDMWAASDHCPVVATFALDPTRAVA